MCAMELEASGGPILGPLSFLVCGRSAQEGRRLPLLMLVAHIDDSGTEGKGRVALLAGFIARAEQWQDFSERWTSALNREPKIEYFRMAEANRRRDQFRGFSEPERDSRVNEFAGIISSVHPHAVASIVTWKDFNEFKTYFRSPVEVYLVLFQSIMWTILSAVKEFYPGEQVECVFDEQGALGSRAASVNDWAAISLSNRYKKLLAGRPLHRSDRLIKPLQAADMLAWHLRRGAAEDKIDFSRMPEPFEGMPLLCSHLSRSRLARLASHAREITERFPEIHSLYTERELKQVRNRFLGYDPDTMS